MRKIILAAAIILLSASPSWAGCLCICENGKPKAQCPSVLEKGPACPVSVCAAANANAPPAPPMSKDCKVGKVLNPQTGQLEVQKVCK